MHEDDAGERWSIGEVSHKTGITVRTLYHYDEIGLVRPAGRTSSGHRRYTAANVRRLYRVRALRSFGLSLGEIAKALEHSNDDLATLRDLLAAQVAELEMHGIRVAQLSRHLSGLLDQLDAKVMPDPDQFMSTLEMISVYETYFTQEQRDLLARRREEAGEELIVATKRQWLELVRALKQHVDAGTLVDDREVRDLAARWEGLATPFKTDDEQANEGINASGKAMWRDHKAEISTGISNQIEWLQPEDFPKIIEYIEAVRAAR
ncbi:MerR family transcriptional regulator [Streptosporangiaceae bacterium NEAU-GS5]|nr:MerR family transcriptional regulator [Streptosporangiaceae bacterium NEAU-GS5]